MPDPAPGPQRRRSMPPLLRVGLFCAVAVIVLVLTGFAIFLFSLERGPSATLPTADGIVVLTGGADRITDATILLTERRGKRLLITGVHPDTTLTEISRTVPATREALECCVELGRSALNTRGNAIETAVWARANDFRSLIVVTSAWHMPRALVELRRAMPDIALLPYPVVARGPREANWWGALATIRLFFVEYLKFLAAYVGIGPWPAVTSEIGTMPDGPTP
ncbi:YdcF family protein [Ancylobacter radicis]|uniref:YdcF family protein n=1 Tax=Ancylobacter radicis TaxID=2836179 RepID=A0ABS5R2X2_9HYPH|nr:YdcF family protein [Ancylobacter radicis]MBS9475999.1 YdcF family protein [Ancylobacter radicis]